MKQFTRYIVLLISAIFLLFAMILLNQKQKGYPVPGM